MVNWIIIWHYYVKAACDTSAVWSFPGRQVITILFSLSMFLFFSNLKIVLTFLFCSFPKSRFTAKAMVRRGFAGLPWLPHVRTSRSGFLLLFFTSRVNSLPPWKKFFWLLAHHSFLQHKMMAPECLNDCPNLKAFVERYFICNHTIIDE